jgi:chromosome segregation ATPase
MEAKNKILDLIAAEDKTLSRLAGQKRTLKLRVSAFESALASLNGDSSSEFLAAKQKLQSKISQEIASGRDVELKMADVQTRKEALKESIDLFPIQKIHTESVPYRINTVTSPALPSTNSYRDLRPKSELYQVRELIRKEGKPMLLKDIVRLMGHPTDQANRGKYASLRGTIGGYAKLGRFFTIETKSPHVIGLTEFKK